MPSPATRVRATRPVSPPNGPHSTTSTSSVASIRAIHRPWPPAWRWSSSASPRRSRVTVRNSAGAKTNAPPDRWGSVVDMGSASGVRPSAPASLVVLAELAALLREVLFGQLLFDRLTPCRGIGVLTSHLAGETCRSFLVGLGAGPGPVLLVRHGRPPVARKSLGQVTDAFVIGGDGRRQVCELPLHRSAAPGAQRRPSAPGKGAQRTVAITSRVFDDLPRPGPRYGVSGHHLRAGPRNLISAVVDAVGHGLRLPAHDPPQTSFSPRRLPGRGQRGCDDQVVAASSSTDVRRVRPDDATGSCAVG